MSEEKTTQRLPAFQHLRVIPWDPEFHWTGIAGECADHINRPHEDYPRRVIDTVKAMIESDLSDVPTAEDLLRIHETVFHDADHAGAWRDCWVRVVLHVPPEPDRIPALMEELEATYRGRMDTVENIQAWYSDFETIHPFKDGNGRVGGVVAAMLSHRLHPERGFLTPGQ